MNDVCVALNRQGCPAISERVKLGDVLHRCQTKDSKLYVYGFEYKKKFRCSDVSPDDRDDLIPSFDKELTPIFDSDNSVLVDIGVGHAFMYMYKAKDSLERVNENQRTIRMYKAICKITTDTSRKVMRCNTNLEFSWCPLKGKGGTCSW